MAKDYCEHCCKRFDVDQLFYTQHGDACNRCLIHLEEEGLLDDEHTTTPQDPAGDDPSRSSGFTTDPKGYLPD